MKKTQFDKRLPSKCVQFPFGKKAKLILLLSFSIALSQNTSPLFAMKDMDETSIDSTISIFISDLTRIDTVTIVRRAGLSTGGALE